MTHEDGVSGQTFPIGDERLEQAGFQYWRENRQMLARKAIQAADHAVSYRGFKVGCAVLAVSRNPFFEGTVMGVNFDVHTGSNLKVRSDVRTTCAEMVALVSALKDSPGFIAGFVIFGTPQEDHASGKHPDFLYPCGECRKTMESLSIISPATKILSIRRPGGVLHTENEVEVLGFPSNEVLFEELRGIFRRRSRREM